MKIWNKIKGYINLRLLIGIVLGGLAGFLYYYYVGCNSGSCPITSKPVNSIVYGAFMGGLLLVHNKDKKPM